MQASGPGQTWGLGCGRRWGTYGGQEGGRAGLGLEERRLCPSHVDGMGVGERPKEDRREGPTVGCSVSHKVEGTVDQAESGPGQQQDHSLGRVPGRLMSIPWQPGQSQVSGPSLLPSRHQDPASPRPSWFLGLCRT